MPASPIWVSGGVIRYAVPIPIYHGEGDRGIIRRGPYCDCIMTVRRYSYDGPIDHEVATQVKNIRGKSVILTGGANGSSWVLLNMIPC